MDFYMQVLWAVLNHLHPDLGSTPDTNRRNHRDFRQLFTVLTPHARAEGRGDDVEDLVFMLRRAARVLRPQDGELYRNPSYGVYILRKEALQFMRGHAKDMQGRTLRAVQDADIKAVLTSPEEPRTDGTTVTLSVPRELWDRVRGKGQSQISPQLVASAPKAPTATNAVLALLDAAELLKRLSADSEVVVDASLGRNVIGLPDSVSAVLNTVPDVQLLVSDVTNIGIAVGRLRGNPEVVQQYYNGVLTYNAECEAYGREVTAFLKVGSKRSHIALNLLLGEGGTSVSEGGGFDLVSYGKVTGETKDSVKVVWPAEKLDELYQQYV